MNKPLRIAALVVLSLCPSGSQTAAVGQEDVAANRTTASETRSPELQVLERFVGSWQETVQQKPAAWTPKPVTITATGTRKCVLNGSMIENKGIWFPGKDEFMHLMSYDPHRKQYRQWYFDKDRATPQEYIGSWDGARQTFTFKGTIVEGVSCTSTQKFVDEDTFTWTLVATDRAGKVVLDMHGKALRNK